VPASACWSRLRSVECCAFPLEENRVQQTINEAPEGVAIFIQNSVFDDNHPGRNLLAASGFTIVRDFVHLQIDMSQKPPDPVWPEGIEVRLLESGDWEKVGPALYEAFDDHWGNIEYETGETEETDEGIKPDPQKTDPQAFDSAYFNSPGLCFVAWDGDQVAGSCLCNATTVEYPEAGYIGSLSIRRPWRQHGIGRALTLHALKTFYERGTTHVLTDTDGDSLTKAFRVYQKAGMHIFRREYVYEKMIRPGRDFVKRKLPILRDDV
jgi:mycothiol synthase